MKTGLLTISSPT